MFKQFTRDHQTVFLKGLEMIRVRKFLLDNYKISTEDKNVFFDSWESLEEFWNDIFEKICGKENFDAYIADQIAGDKLGFTLYYDPDEVAYQCFELRHPAITKYIAYVKSLPDYEYTKEWDETYKLAEKIILFTQWGEEAYSSFVNIVAPCLVFMCSTYDYFDIGFLEELFFFIEFCETELRRLKIDDV